MQNNFDTPCFQAAVDEIVEYKRRCGGAPGARKTKKRSPPGTSFQTIVHKWEARRAALTEAKTHCT